MSSRSFIRWWFQTFSEFSPLSLGEMIPFDILSSGLIQPPTSLGPTVDLVDFGAAGSL